MEYLCKLCPGLIFDNEGLVEHHEDLHVERNRNCAFCDSKFDSLIAMKQHVTNYHQNAIGLHDKVSLPDGGLLRLSLNSEMLIKHLSRVGVSETKQLVKNETFLLSYDNRIRMARWSFEILMAHDMKKFIEHQAPPYQDDVRVSKQMTPLILEEDEMEKGVGQLATPFNHSHNSAGYKATFLMTNTVPIKVNLMDTAWNRVGAWCRELALKRDRVFVFSGPILNESKWEMVIGGFYVPIVDGFFKIILMETEEEDAKCQCFLFKNERQIESLFQPHYHSSLEEIHKFLPELNFLLTCHVSPLGKELLANLINCGYLEIVELKTLTRAHA